MARWTVLLLALLAPSALGGTGGGNEFFRYEKPDFDFHVDGPTDWPCDGCAKPSARAWDGPASVWSLTAPEKTTWMHITFLADDPAANEADLLKEIQTPGVVWTEMDRGGFTGWSSSPIGQDANAATEYYLVTPHRVVRIEWQKDKSSPERAHQLDLVKSSIDRVSEPPQIREIRTEKDQAYKVGDDACVLITVQDLRGSLSLHSLSSVAFEGVLDHWSFKRVAFDPVASRYRVCTTVTTAFGPTGLRLKSLSLEMDESGRDVGCYPDDKDPLTLVCSTYQTFSGQPKVQRVRQQIAAVDHAADLSGPRVHAVTADAAKLTLTIDAEATSGVHAAEIFCGDKSRTVFPDELAPPARPFDIARLVHEGWNTIDKIVLYDETGVPTLLRVGRSSTRNYEVVSWKGEVSQSDVPVVTFLKDSGGAR